MVQIKTYKIYTAGKMGGLTYEQQMLWRSQIEHLVKKQTDKSVNFIHPPMFYQYGQNYHKSEREAMIWDISQIKDSDIVVVDLNTIADSIGTHIELGIAEAMNEFGYKHIHVIGIGEPNTDHPWIPLTTLRIEPTVEKAAEYIVNYLLV